MALSRLYCSGDGDKVWCDVYAVQNYAQRFRVTYSKYFEVFGLSKLAILAPRGPTKSIYPLGFELTRLGMRFSAKDFRNYWN
jgi:hypothetical protein